MNSHQETKRGGVPLNTNAISNATRKLAKRTLACWFTCRVQRAVRCEQAYDGHRSVTFVGMNVNVCLRVTQLCGGKRLLTNTRICATRTLSTSLPHTATCQSTSKNSASGCERASCGQCQQVTQHSSNETHSAFQIHLRNLLSLLRLPSRFHASPTREFCRQGMETDSRAHS